MSYTQDYINSGQVKFFTNEHSNWKLQRLAFMQIPEKQLLNQKPFWKLVKYFAEIFAAKNNVTIEDIFKHPNDNFHYIDKAIENIKLLHRTGECLILIDTDTTTDEEQKQFYDFLDNDEINGLHIMTEDDVKFLSLLGKSEVFWYRNEPPVRIASQDHPFANETEEKFKEWLDHHGVAWHYIDQSPTSFAAIFRGLDIKRPDFSVTTKLGEIAIDVKSRRLQEKYNSVLLDSADDIEKYRNYQKLYNCPLYFVFHLEGTDYSEFYWINLQDVLDKTTKRISGHSGEPFRPIPLELCTKITWEDNLSKLLE